MLCKSLLEPIYLSWCGSFFSSQVFCNKNKTVLKEGDILKFTKLAKTMQVIADTGAEAFYSGSVGEDLIKDIHEAGLVALTVVPVYTAISRRIQRNVVMWEKWISVTSIIVVLQGGILNLEDLKSFKVRMMDAWKVPLGEADLHVAPPPAGGALLAFILRLMKGFQPLFSVVPLQLHHRSQLLKYKWVCWCSPICRVQLDPRRP